MRPIPHQREGYSVDAVAGVVHRRYPAHGDVRPRVRNLRGVRAYLQGADGRPCERCWPAPAAPAEPSKRPRRSRGPAVSELKAVVAAAAVEAAGPEAGAAFESGFENGFVSNATTVAEIKTDDASDGGAEVQKPRDPDDDDDDRDEDEKDDEDE